MSELKCRDCGRAISKGYYRSGSGREMLRPACDSCYEDAVRRHTRDGREDDERMPVFSNGNNVLMRRGHRRRMKEPTL